MLLDMTGKEIEENIENIKLFAIITLNAELYMKNQQGVLLHTDRELSSCITVWDKTLDPQSIEIPTVVWSRAELFERRLQ